jgi:hypothetical protein
LPVRGALLEEGLLPDALGRLDLDDVGLAKTASRHVLGVKEPEAFEIGWHADHAGGLWNLAIDELNRHLRRSDYRVRLELVHHRLAADS